MANARRIVIEFLGKDKSLGSTAASAESRTSKLGGTLKKVGLIAGGALAAGTLVAGKAIWDMAKAAAEDEKSQVALARTLKNTTGATKQQVAAVEDWISKQGVALGVADGELRPALDRLVRSTKDVGEAQRLASLAMNISAGTGKSLKTVSDALGKAHDGNTGALGRLGIATKNAKGESLSFEQVVKNASDTFKGQASDAANTFEGKMGRLKLVFGETKEALGAKLLPILSDLGTWFLRKGLPAIQRFGGWMRENLGPILARIGEWIRTKLIPAARDMFSWFVDKIVPGLKRYLTPVLEGVRALFAKIGEKLEENRPQLEKLKNAFKTVAEFMANRVMPVIGTIVGKYGLPLLGTIIGGLIDSVGWLIDKLDWLISKLKDAVDWIGKIDVPDLNPFSRAAAPGSPGAGSTGSTVAAGSTFSSFTPRGGVNAGTTPTTTRGGIVFLEVNFNGIVGDRRAAARELVTLLNEELRRDSTLRLAAT